jgi:hypothetical protein
MAPQNFNPWSLAVHSTIIIISSNCFLWIIEENMIKSEWSRRIKRAENYQKTHCSVKFDGFGEPPYWIANSYQPKNLTGVLIIAYSELGQSPWTGTQVNILDLSINDRKWIIGRWNEYANESDPIDQKFSVQWLKDLNRYLQWNFKPRTILKPLFWTTRREFVCPKF